VPDEYDLIVPGAKTSFKDLYKDNQLIDVARSYFSQRDGRDLSQASPEEVADLFVSDRTWKQSNTVSILRELNYITGGTVDEADAAQKQRLAFLRKRWDELPGLFDKGGRGVSGALSNVWRGALDPSIVAGGAAGKAASTLVGKGAATAAGIAAGTAVDAGISAGVDAANQQVDVETGRQTEVDLGQAAVAGAIGGAASLGGQALASWLNARGAGKAAGEVAEEVGTPKPTSAERAAEAIAGVKTDNPAIVATEALISARSGQGPSTTPAMNFSTIKNDTDIVKAMKGLIDINGNYADPDAVRRGTVSTAQTIQDAFSFADDPKYIENYLSRQRGMGFVNTEDVVAAKRVMMHMFQNAANLNDIAKAAGATAEDKARALQAMQVAGRSFEVFTGARTEQGRALRALQIIPGESPEKTLQMFFENLNKSKGTGAGVGKIGIGYDDFDSVSKMFDQAIKDGNAKGAAAVGKALADPTGWDKFREAYIMGLLSNPQTLIVNAFGNSLALGMNIAETWVTAGVGGMRAAVGSKAPRVTFEEAAAKTGAMFAGIRDGSRMFMKALTDENFADSYYGMALEQVRGPAIGGVTGKVIRVPGRFMAATDQFYRALAKHMAEQEFVMREVASGRLAKEDVSKLLQNPTKEMMQHVAKEMDYWTFQKELGQAGKALQSISQSNAVGTVLMPFVRTPINLLKFVVERTPMANMLMSESRNALIPGGVGSLATPAGLAELVTKHSIDRDVAVARLLTGSMLFSLGAMMAQAGVLTGSGPADKDQKRVWEDAHKPYSIWNPLNKEWVQINKLDPIVTFLGLGADIGSLVEEVMEKDKGDIFAAIRRIHGDKQFEYVMNILGSNIAEKTMLTGISNVMEAFQSENMFQNWLNNVARTAVPRVVAQAERVFDPTQRAPENIGEAIQQDIPGLSSAVRPLVGAFGEERKQGGSTAIAENIGRESGPIRSLDDFLSPTTLVDFLSPFWKTVDKPNKFRDVVIEMHEDLYSRGKTGLVIKPAERDYKGVKLNPEQYQYRQTRLGQRTNEFGNYYVKQPYWERLRDDQKALLLERAITFAREVSNNELLAKFPELEKQTKYKEMDRMFNNFTPENVERNLNRQLGPRNEGAR
jgi:hypothetical protein